MSMPLIFPKMRPKGMEPQRKATSGQSQRFMFG